MQLSVRTPWPHIHLATRSTLRLLLKQWTSGVAQGSLTIGCDIGGAIWSERGDLFPRMHCLGWCHIMTLVAGAPGTICELWIIAPGVKKDFAVDNLGIFFWSGTTLSKCNENYPYYVLALLLKLHFLIRNLRHHNLCVQLFQTYYIYIFIFMSMICIYRVSQYGIIPVCLIN